MLVAGTPSLELILLTCLGGYLSAGGAGAVNHCYDRDIDARMARTADRPVPAGRVSARAATSSARARRAVAVELSLSVNPLAAALVVLRLRRLHARLHRLAQAPHAAEHRHRRRGRARPPLVGWAAVTGGLDGMAVYLFAIVFFWTPPHFWALSLLMKDEYERVGVPMLPVVRGEAETRRQILLYSVLLYAVTQLPFCAGGLGTIYLVASFVLGVLFIGGAWLLSRAPTGARRCACTCSRSPISPCSSALWSPTSSSRIRTLPWTAISPARTSAPASSSPRCASSCSA
jgi:protoheme IX farnesyltransferase